MLFSRDEVARFVNQSFEPVWESVRPVPIVRIDFGNGTVVTRTLHGNIATYVCTAEGQVIDVVPGIYTPDVYREQLTSLLAVAASTRGHDAQARAAFLKQYHDGRMVQAAVPVKLKDLTKLVAIEGPVARLVQVARAPQRNEENVNLDRPEDLANWKVLVEDTRANEADRRRQIHVLLAGAGLVRPEAVSRRIYKDVLHADLDDPYLGLGAALFGNYPFAREDQSR